MLELFLILIIIVLSPFAVGILYGFLQGLWIELKATIRGYYEEEV